VIEKPYVERLKAEKRARLESGEPVFAAALAKPADQRTELEKQQAKDAQRMLNVSWDEILAVLSPEDKARRAALRQQMHRISLFAPEPLPKALAVSESITPTPAMHLLQGRRSAPAGAGGAARIPDRASPAAVRLERRDRSRREGGFQIDRTQAGLANWLTRPDHPLTSRVIVNRLWHYHFGRGIVPTPNDFGRNGQPPTHLELLDWLSVEFVKSGWSLKKMHYLMVTSRTYRQSSRLTRRVSRKILTIAGSRRMNRQRARRRSAP
jgi:hypothetical protein